MIAELEQTGVLSQPRTRAKFDRTAVPALPLFVQLPTGEAKPRRSEASVAASRMAWRPETMFATTIGTLTEEELAVLEAANRFLGQAGSRPVVPVQERSLELFGHEKALDRLQAGRLFGAGRLTLSLLRCAPSPPPFPFRVVGDGRTLLVVENSATFRSLSALAQGSDVIGWVGYGGGNAFAASAPYALELEPAPERVVYFGDLDAGGLRTAHAADRAAQAAGLPPLEPAVSLYRALLEHGVVETKACTPVSGSDARRLAAWLPTDLQEQTVALLEQGSRVAQEAISFEMVSCRPQLLKL